MVRKSKAVEKQSTAIKGGKRPGAGRKKGVPNKKTAKLQEEVAASGVTPLDYMLNIMRKEVGADMTPADLLAAITLRFEAAKAAAPYVHPRLAAVEHSGGVTIRTLAEELAELNAGNG